MWKAERLVLYSGAEFRPEMLETFYTKLISLLRDLQSLKDRSESERLVLAKKSYVDFLLSCHDSYMNHLLRSGPEVSPSERAAVEAPLPLEFEDHVPKRWSPPSPEADWEARLTRVLGEYEGWKKEWSEVRSLMADLFGSEGDAKEQVREAFRSYQNQLRSFTKDGPFQRFLLSSHQM